MEVVIEGISPVGEKFVESPTKRAGVEKLVEKGTGKVWAYINSGQLVIQNKVWKNELERDMGISIPFGLRNAYEGKKFVLKKDGALFTEAFKQVWLPRFKQLEWR